MNIRRFSSQFSVVVFTSQVDEGAAIKVALSRAGYEAYYIDNENGFIERVSELTPHLVVLDLNSLKTSLSDLVEKIQNISLEIRLIFLAADENFQVASEYESHGVMDILSRQASFLDQRVLWSVDRACERIYFQLQNEQLLTDVEKLKAEKKPASEASSSAEIVDEEKNSGAPGNSASWSLPVFELIKELRLSQSKEQLLQNYFECFSQISLVFLKYLPALNTFVVTHSSAASPNRVEGLGCQLTSEESRDLVQNLTLNIVPPSLQEILQKAFHFKSVRLRPVFDGSALEGVVATPILNEPLLSRMEESFSIFNLAYSHFCLEKRLDLLEVQDPVTEIYNEKFYQRKIGEEFQRSRRFKQPLSLIKLSLDDFSEIEKTLGEPTRDLVLKNLAALVQKTSRANDVACRTGLNQISILMPHCAKRGAEQRAERLRRIVESHSLLDSGLKLSISLGASEYPTLCASPEKLDETAAKALQFIAGKGGNKLCFYKAPPQHQPEFPVVEEESH